MTASCSEGDLLVALARLCASWWWVRRWVSLRGRGGRGGGGPRLLAGRQAVGLVVIWSLSFRVCLLRSWPLSGGWCISAG